MIYSKKTVLYDFAHSLGGFDIFNENWERILVAHIERTHSVLGHEHERVFRIFDFEGDEVLRITSPRDFRRSKV